jgi:hypothetical protein
MRQGYNPTRRNRNIGTIKQGHGTNNRLVIPSICHAERSWPLQLGRHEDIVRNVAGRAIKFFIEQTDTGFAHACSVQDVCAMLELIPAADWEGLDCFILKQSTQKQRLLRPAWGRMFYYGTVGLVAKKDIYAGPLVILESQNWDISMKWSKSLGPEEKLELNRLESDGHKVALKDKYIEISSTLDSIRNTQLYRTLLHEIGHWLDYQEKVERPAMHEDSDYGLLSDSYFARPTHEREAFAHRYADSQRRRLLDSGLIPLSLTNGTEHQILESSRHA